MKLCQYVDLCFHASSLPCLHTYWHATPTSFYNFLYSSTLMLISVTAKPNLESKRSILSSVEVTTAQELEIALIV